ncbi:MAG: methyltransferase domain-containing protein [Flavobacteriales bacterium]|jgi:SAM-dependent methyltransferase
MEITRRPLQGVSNIIRFNWPFYAIAAVALALLIFFRAFLPEPIQHITLAIAVLISAALLISLLISHLIYDHSSLYELRWMDGNAYRALLNVNAGFDEITPLIRQKRPDAVLTNCDFFDPATHTEKSILRARKAYPPTPGSFSVSPHQLPFADRSFDAVIAFLSAHEIRNDAERAAFFTELRRVLTDDGEIIITEHLRDRNNFMAYTIGFFHFHSRSSWMRTFDAAGLKLMHETKTTPFITTFILKKHGAPSSLHRNPADGTGAGARHLP